MVIPSFTEQTLGRYIVIDGAPGVGASTQLELLAKRLRANNYRVQIFTDPPKNTGNTLTNDAVKKAKQAGYICLRKRFELSPALDMYYRMQGDYTAVNEAAAGIGPDKPDIVLILDVPADILLQRLTRQNSSEQHGEPTLAQLDRLRTGYLWEAKQRGYHVIHAVSSPELIHEEIWQLLRGEPQPVPPINPPPVFGNPSDIKNVIAEKKKVIEEKAEVTAEQSAPFASRLLDSQRSSHKTVSLLAALDIAVQADGDYQEAPLVAVGERAGYYIPPALPSGLREQYVKTVDKIIQSRQSIITSLTAHLISTSVVAKSKQTPAFKKTVATQAARITEGLLPLAFHVSVATNDRVVRVNPATSQELSDYSDNNSSDIELQKLVTANLPNRQGTMDQDLQLVSYVPRNEFDLIPAMLYEYTNHNLRDITKAVNTWKYEQKYEVFKLYTGRAFQLANYTWDIQSDCMMLRDIVALPTNNQILRQQLTPRYGFDIPLPIEEAGLEEDYEACFDASAELYSTMQSEGFEQLAPYTVLLGHRNRWSLNISAPEIFMLEKSNNITTQKLARAMEDKLAEIHPILSDVLFASNNA